MNSNITDSIKYVGVDDKTLDLFEAQYTIPNGISYNSYIIKDKKNVIMDTVDKRKTDQWVSNINNVLKNEQPDYLVISHLEPDHSANITLLAEKYPNMKIILSKRAADMLPQFTEIDVTNRTIIVQEGDIVDVGSHKLQFFMAPMVHWPEVMVTYEQSEKILFSADAFGKFGTLDIEEDWTSEARRYYFNIVGKYGVQVQQLLKKISGLNINLICPLHGPVLNKNLDFYIQKYDIWSSYKPEDNGILIAYNSIYGNTRKAIQKLVDILNDNKIENIIIKDLSREDKSQLVADAFRYDKIIVASTTYDSGLFPATENFLKHLQHKNFQNRKMGIIENGSWAPMAAKYIQEIVSNMKEITIVNPIITIKTKMNQNAIDEMNEMAKEFLK